MNHAAECNPDIHAGRILAQMAHTGKCAFDRTPAFAEAPTRPARESPEAARRY